MTTVATSIPDEIRLELHHGEEVQFQALVQEDGSFLVTSLLQSPPTPVVPVTARSSGAPRTLGDWALKWSGSLNLAEGESRPSLRDAYLTEKFGA